MITDTKVPLFKDHFWHFQIKIKFRKKLRGRAASDYRTLISGLFPDNNNTSTYEDFLKTESVSVHFRNVQALAK